MPSSVLACATTARPLRRVTLGARPWARFTIDGDRKLHETPETVELSPGKRDSKMLADGGRLATGQVSPFVNA